MANLLGPEQAIDYVPLAVPTPQMGRYVGAPDVPTWQTDTEGMPGFVPPEGTRTIPEGISANWRITNTQSRGGVMYYDPESYDAKLGDFANHVRVMPGNPNSSYPNSQEPYVRWQLNGQPLDVNGNILPNKTIQMRIFH